MSSKQNHNSMSSYSFTKNGYHYFLVSDGDGLYRLHSDADYLQYLQANETKPGIITSITNGEIVLLTRGEKFGDRVVTEIQRIEGSPTVFKVKLSEKEIWYKPNISAFSLQRFYNIDIDFLYNIIIYRKHTNKKVLWTPKSPSIWTNKW